MSKKLDLIVFGATGFTGRLVAEYLHRQYGADSSVRWAMAGRSLAKLEQVRDLIQAPRTVPLLTADATDPAALRQLVASTRAVITTVGPYQLHGEPLLQACVDTGCDYLDLCGEPAWMAQMIQRHHAAALASGARIVFSCGFDSVPFDLGVRFLQHHAIQRDGHPLRHVQGRVMVMKGGFSGGTAASLVETMAAMGRDPEAARAMANPFALTPGFNGPPQPDTHQAQLDDFTGAWSAPFVMAPINTKNVHRSNALLGHLYGRDFVYEERLSCGPGRSGELRARGTVRTETIQNALLGFGPTRALVACLCRAVESRLDRRGHQARAVLGSCFHHLPDQRHHRVGLLAQLRRPGRRGGGGHRQIQVGCQQRKLPAVSPGPGHTLA